MSKQVAVSWAIAIVFVVASVSTAFALNVGLFQASNTDPGADTEAGADTVGQQTQSDAHEPTMAPAPTAGEETTGLQIFPEGTEIITVYVDEPIGEEPEAAAPAAESVASWPVAQPTRTSGGPAPAATAASSSTGPSPPAPTAAPASTPTAQPTPVPPQPAVTPAPASTPTPVPTVAAPAYSYPTYGVGGAGEVTLRSGGGEIVFWAAHPVAGWSYHVEKNGPTEVKVKLAKIVNGEDEGEVEFTAKLQGNQITIEVGDD